MTAAARPAVASDLNVLVGLYRSLESEMTALSSMWPKTSGLAEPVGESMAGIVESSMSAGDDHVVLGTYDGYPFGLMYGKVSTMLPQAGGELLGSIRLVFVEREARAVGVGEAMRDHMLAWFRARGATLHDAHVLPGHRLAKNFFESGGFSARHIVMHHDDTDD